jgi:hypothetical protein
MREQVTRFSDARASGDNAGLLRIKPALYDMVEKYMKDMDKDEKDGLAPDVVKTCKDQVYEVVKEALEFFDHFSGENPAYKPEDSLAPLRKAIVAATHLVETVAKEVQDPSEERLRDLTRKLGAAKKEIMALSRSLIVGQAATLATEAHRIASDAGEVIKSSR